MDGLSEALLIKALLALCLVVGLVWGAGLLLRQLKCFHSNQKMNKLTRVLDTCSLDAHRKIIIFACPFGQGVVLVSPKGDQMFLFPPDPEIGRLS